MTTTVLYYAGIGSRETPPDILVLMKDIGHRMGELGIVLRSGAADGADSAFEEGCDRVSGPKEIWLPWRGFNGHADTGFYPTPAHAEVAATVHPAWERLSQGPQKLHSRNVGQVLGQDIKTPVSCVVCWTRDGCVDADTRTRDTGGTGQAIVLAARHGIPVFNLFNAGAMEALEAHLVSVYRKFHLDGTLPQNGETFVFGSNLAGRHGKGAALVAREKFGAIYGKGRGPMGNCYAVPTKDGRPNTPDLKDPAATRSLADIKKDIDGFLAYARQRMDEEFFIVRLGCDLAAHSDSDIAPLFGDAPPNCNFPEQWRPWLGVLGHRRGLAPAVNIFSGSPGLAGALTNMSERAREKGCIKNAYPVKVGEVVYPDSEAAYQALKHPGRDAYNDGLMIDLIALKFKQNSILFERVTRNGGAPWLESCSHFTGAQSERFQAWEGQGMGSRFIRNLVYGYLKAKTGIGPETRVVHVKEAPYDVYIGRDMPGLEGTEWANEFRIGPDGTREQVVEAFYQKARKDKRLMAKVASLKGKTIACWCKSRANPDHLCHGDVLAALADGREWVAPKETQGELF